MQEVCHAVFMRSGTRPPPRAQNIDDGAATRRPPGAPSRRSGSTTGQIGHVELADEAPQAGLGYGSRARHLASSRVEITGGQLTSVRLKQPFHGLFVLGG